MHSRQPITLIQRVTPDPLAQWIAQSRSLVEKELGVVGGSQALQELLHGRREPVVNLVPGSPERVSSRRGQRVDLEHGVIRGHRLKRDVRVPAG